ncbi:hypothetical protein ATO8_18120 [Roseivivax marinus]|uniref:Uncharacterized protein n=2 Tax=Roseivivax marinus TaxID=1379903 RepID=W4HGH2_9RHOB|nr:hypothetical protein ATO8_18120 [Roseivivax marinus]
MFRIAEEFYGTSISYTLQRDVLQMMQEWSGNIIVIEGRWWPEQDDDYRDVVEDILAQSNSDGRHGRRYLEFEEPEMYPDWQPMQGHRDDSVFADTGDALHQHLGELIDGTDITITGGWRETNLKTSPIDMIAFKLLTYCPTSSIEIARNAYDQDIAGEEYLARIAW